MDVNFVIDIIFFLYPTMCKHTIRKILNFYEKLKWEWECSVHNHILSIQSLSIHEITYFSYLYFFHIYAFLELEIRCIISLSHRSHLSWISQACIFKATLWPDYGYGHDDGDCKLFEYAILYFVQYHHRYRYDA